MVYRSVECAFTSVLNGTHAAHASASNPPTAGRPCAYLYRVNQRENMSSMCSGSSFSRSAWSPFAGNRGTPAHKGLRRRFAKFSRAKFENFGRAVKERVARTQRARRHGCLVRALPTRGCASVWQTVLELVVARMLLLPESRQSCSSGRHRSTRSLPLSLCFVVSASLGTLVNHSASPSPPCLACSLAHSQRAGLPLVQSDLTRVCSVAFTPFHLHNFISLV
jgi:hypothetical protein